LNDIKLFMMSKYGIDRTNQAFGGVHKAIIKSLIAVQKLVANDKRSFELYGYDFLFDAKMKPWLLEVNGGPSMSANTDADSDLKIGLIDDVMTILDLEKMYALL
jgi:tubulin polyglutamylase TTLL9